MDPLVTLIGGGIVLAVALTKQARQGAEWTSALNEAAATLGGRVTFPSMRAELGITVVSLEVRNLEKQRPELMVDAVLAAEASSARLYVGIGVMTPPAALAHIPEVLFATALRVKARVFVKSDDPEIARRFFQHHSDTLSDLFEALAPRAIEVIYRGGRVHVGAVGVPPMATRIVELMRATARLRDYEATAPFAPASERATAGFEPAATAPMPSADTTRDEPAHGAFGPRCTLCSEHGDRQPWLRCVRCDSPYHARCWQIATGCVTPDCPETRALAS